MRFMLVFYMPEDTWIDKETVRRVVSWKKKWRDEGVWEQGSPLKPPGLTHTLQLRSDGRVDLIEGPSSDDDPIFYAFEILKCKTLEAALEVAATHPALGFEKSVLEVREIWDQIDPDFMGDEYDEVSPDYHLEVGRNSDTKAPQHG